MGTQEGGQDVGMDIINEWRMKIGGSEEKEHRERRCEFGIRDAISHVIWIIGQKIKCFGPEIVPMPDS
jgi:hypothetical protein